VSTLLRFAMAAAVVVNIGLQPGRSDAQPPRLILSEGKDLEAVKRKYQSGDMELAKKIKSLRNRADEALKISEISVVQSMRPRKPDGSKRNDYVSLSPYAWPDSTTPDHLPYQLKDGERNESEIKLYDAPLLVDLSNSVKDLALTYYFTDDDKYAVHAGKLLRVWFLNPLTAMSPNMQYAGFRPGWENGKGTHLGDARHLAKLIDWMTLIETSKSWTKSDQKKMTSWYRDFLTWMQTSELGQKERKQLNNLGCWYDAEVVACAIFVGDMKTAKRTLEDVKKLRVATQIEPDGKQGKELSRKTSFHYSVYNLEALFALATMGQHADVDLWNYKTVDGRGIRKAVDFLLPYAPGTQKWPYPEHDEIKYWEFVPILRRAANAYNEKNYEQAIVRTKGFTEGLKRTEFLYPAR
jgi:hypothetical protein